MDITAEVLTGILDAYPYEIVFVDRTHTVRWLNRAARRRYGDTVRIGSSIFGCHNERTRPKIEAFLRRADLGEDEMFEAYNGRTGEREFFVPVRDDAGRVIGYFERHEVPWTKEHAEEPVGDYWTGRAEAEVQ
ncbi:MAG: PAS domain-containing protein [Clostridia bacterium]|nr:PAS domain-containing protein [Clostridia bacterium]